ncbi:MAG: hypothetical protein MZV64_10065 [Ignavibacteriales bacterium]|nr:hypothetical protein [Ignavibacteriales bacterium]
MPLLDHRARDLGNLAILPVFEAGLEGTAVVIDRLRLEIAGGQIVLEYLPQGDGLGLGLALLDQLIDPFGKAPQLLKRQSAGAVGFHLRVTSQRPAFGRALALHARLDDPALHAAGGDAQGEARQPGIADEILPSRGRYSRLGDGICQVSMAAGRLGHTGSSM